MSDSQKLELLPKFVTGEVYEVIERVAGCSYEAIMEILHERYGNPAAVAAACIENLTNGPKLSNNDYTGLRNLAEQLELAAKKLFAREARSEHHGKPETDRQTIAKLSNQ